MLTKVADKWDRIESVKMNLGSDLNWPTTL